MMLALLRMRVQVPGAREVLNNVADGFVDRYLVGRAAALDFSGQHFADLRDDVVVANQAGLLCVEELCTLTQNAFTAVRNKARAHDEIVVDFGWASITGADEIDVSAGPNPCTFEDGLARASDSADDVCVRGGFFGVCDSRDREAEFRLVLCGEGARLFRRSPPNNSA